MMKTTRLTNKYPHKQKTTPTSNLSNPQQKSAIKIKIKTIQEITSSLTREKEKSDSVVIFES